MRIPLGSITMGGPYPPDAGVSIDVAKKACAIAFGTWDSAAGGCSIPEPVSPPAWCDWVPFSGTMDACKLPDAAELTRYGSYTAYKIAQKPTAACQPTYQNGKLVAAAPGCTTTGEAAAQQIMVVGNQQSNDLIDSAGCAYRTAQEYPWLAQTFGPDISCGLAHPFDSDSYGWLIYGTIAVGMVLMFTIASRR